MAPVVKNLPANAGDIREDPGVRKIPWRRARQPTPCLQNPMDREARQAIVYRVAKSQTRLKQLSTHTMCQKRLTRWASLSKCISRATSEGIVVISNHGGTWGLQLTEQETGGGGGGGVRQAWTRRSQGGREGHGEKAGREQPGNVLTTSQEGSHFPRGQRPVTSRPANLTEASCSAGWACSREGVLRLGTTCRCSAPRDRGTEGG